MDYKLALNAILRDFVLFAQGKASRLFLQDSDGR